VLGDEIMMNFKEQKVAWVGVKSAPAASNGVFHPAGQESPLLKEMEPFLQPFGLSPESLE